MASKDNLTTDDLFRAQLQATFIEEASSLIEDCEESFLRLGTAEDPQSELNKIFRAAHSIKGSGAAAGFDVLASFAHAVEDLLSALRLDASLVSREAISVLLASGDAMRAHIECLRSGKAYDETVMASVKADVLSMAAAARSNSAKVAPSTPMLAAAIPGAMSSLASAEGVSGFGIFDDDTTATVESGSVGQAPGHQPDGVLESKSPNPAQAAGQLAVRSTVKVDSERLDSVLDLTSELVVIRNQLETKIKSDPLFKESGSGVSQVLSLLDKTVRDLQEKTLSLRLTPIRPLFIRLQRLARDLSLKLSKDVFVEVDGDETELDRTLVESLSDPLMHVIRNSLDHGIESSNDRASRGKPPVATVKLRAAQEKGRVVIEISDDGRGISRDRVIKKALERGIFGTEKQAELASDEDVFSLIMQPGFSTADKVSDLSGRGVGLDVVRSEVERLKGTIKISSEEGRGTRMTLVFPLTASVMDGLLVSAGGHAHVIPLTSVVRMITVLPEMAFEVAPGCIAVKDKGETFRAVDLGSIVRASPHFPESGDETSKNSTVDTRASRKRRLAVVVEETGQKYAIFVDSVEDQTQVVMKPLTNMIESCGLSSASAILGDGRVAFILDMAAVCKLGSEKGSTWGDLMGMAS